MDTLPYYCTEFGSFDDEYHQFISFDHDYQNNSDSMTYFDVFRQPSDQIFGERYNQGSNQYTYPQTSFSAYPTYPNIAASSATADLESPVEEFQYIDYQSYVREPQASLDVSYSPVKAVERRQDLCYPPIPRQSNATSSSPAMNQKNSSGDFKAVKPLQLRHTPYTAPSNSYIVSPRQISTATEPSSNVNCRPTKKSKGPPKDQLTVFDSNIEPHTRRKPRRAFSEADKKKVEAVRRVGACTECRFRKRTCGTSRPCQACIKRTGSAETASEICIRESPINDFFTTELYDSFSRTRIVDFNVDFGNAEGRRKIFIIDGKGPSSRPLHFIVLEVKTSSLSSETIDALTGVQSLASPPAIDGNIKPILPKYITILDSDVLSVLDLGRWAVEYAYIFTKKNNVYATAFILGVEYLRSSLPHSALVANMLKVIALNYVIFYDVEITPDYPNSANHWPILRAQIDTKLFQSLCRAEKLVYHALHQLLFRNPARLTRDAMMPVCLVLWLLRTTGLPNNLLSKHKTKSSSGIEHSAIYN